MKLSSEAVRSLDDLNWLDAVVSDARVVAIGESSHYNREFYQLRHRLQRYLAERHGFRAYAMESGFTEGWLVNEWLGGGDHPLDHVMANGLTSFMGLWQEMRAHLEWMRQHSCRFYGIDLGGSNASLLPGLDAVATYLSVADPEHFVDSRLRETAATFAATSAFAIPTAFAAYASLAHERKDVLTAGLADLTARLTDRRAAYIQRTGVDAYERALHSARLVTAMDALIRAMTGGDQPGAMLGRETAIADTVEWILRREDRIVLAAHNGHVQRSPATMPDVPATEAAGVLLADRLGTDYVVIGTTFGTGQILTTSIEDFQAGRLFTDTEPVEPDSLDGIMTATHDGSFATDLRRLSTADTDVLRTVTRHRFGAHYAELSPLDAYDALVHFPNVTPAELDPGAVAESHENIRRVLS